LALYYSELRYSLLYDAGRDIEVTKIVLVFIKEFIERTGIAKKKIMIDSKLWNLVFAKCGFNIIKELLFLCDDCILHQYGTGNNCLHYLVSNKKISLVKIRDYSRERRWSW